MRVRAFDSETWLIEPGLLAPPLVCVQYTDDLGEPKLFHRDGGAKAIVKSWLMSDDILVGHNVAYDFGVIAAQWPDLVPLIFTKYDRHQVTDTLIREQLLMIARGTFRSEVGSDGERYAVKYSLDACVMRHFGRPMQKEGWRLFYRVFDALPDPTTWAARAQEFQGEVRARGIPDWAQGLVKDKDIQALLGAAPDEPVRYALGDATETLELYAHQEAIAAFKPGVLADQYRQARAAFALHLSSCWGVYTDAAAVGELEARLRAEFESLQFELQAAGLIRQDGTADTKAAQALMLQACEEEDAAVARTAKGAVSLGAEACGQFTDDDGNPLDDVGDAAYAIALYSKFLTVRKTLSNDIKMLRAGCESPLQPRYDLADTGRTRCSKPNVQAINRGAGIREAFRPRPGTVFAQADYEGLELHTLAAWCLEVIGWSRLADDLNAGKDVHTVMAAEILGITYEEAMARKKAGDKEIKEYRQRAKALNFGLPGGLGVKKFVRYAKTSYGVTITEQEAAQYKQRWLQRYPEMTEFFRLAGVATNNPEKLGDETHLFTGRMRGNVRYSALCNGRFQGLGADAAKEALWRVTKACYADASSPLFGCRVVAFVHDEIIIEAPEARASAAAKELGRLMREGADVYLSKVPTRLEPLLMTQWSKNAEPVYDDNGDLLPWTPEWAAEKKAKQAA